MQEATIELPKDRLVLAGLGDRGDPNVTVNRHS